MKISTRINLVKRVADGFEKLSIGALVLGLFQFNYYAIAVGISCFFNFIDSYLYFGGIQMNGVWLLFTVFCIALAAFGFYLAFSLKNKHR